MTSMKITAAERKARKDRYKDSPCTLDGGDTYPHGLRVELNDESLTKLGIKALPDVGGTMQLVATVKITAASQRDREGGVKDRDLTLQITDMTLSDGGAVGAVKAALAKTA